jgi:hypothetical protein
MHPKENTVNNDDDDEINGSNTESNDEINDNDDANNGNDTPSRTHTKSTACM